MKVIYALLIPIFRCMETCLIDCRNSTSPLPTVSGEVEVLLSAAIGAFSVDYNEVCTMLPGTSFLSSDSSSKDFYEFETPYISATRDLRSFHGVCGPNFTTSFEYLNASESGAILRGEYTYGCASTDFYPDDSYLPRPESRTQRCMYGIHLTPWAPNEFGAAFWSQKQPVAYGFDTTFKFRVLHRSKQCGVQQSPNQGKWCYERGGRGFAFVVQNEGSPGINGTGDEISYKLNGIAKVNLGYMFPRNLAIEFDYSFNTESNDPSWNHIAVMVPVVKEASEADNSNYADHATNTLAMASGVELPTLHEGLHTVRVTYAVHSTDKWQHLSSEWFSRPSSENQRLMTKLWSHGKPGILQVFLDEKRVIKALVDLSQVVQTSSGDAWVGFVAATGTDEYSSPIIADWRWTSSSMCLADDLSDSETLTCARGHVVGDPDNAETKFKLRNIGTVDIQIIATLEDNQASVCENGVLSWNQIHPYYLGCQRTVALGANLTSLLITDTLAVRSLRLTDPTLIDRDYTGTTFLRREIPEYCVIEHESDPYRFYFAQCDCEFCARVFDNQQLYSIFYSGRCSERYTYTCACFEVSQMASDTYAFDYNSRPNPWKFVSQPGYNFSTKNMQFQRHSVCRGCKFDYHCSRLNKLGVCETPSTVYHVGNPLKPTMGGSFQNWSRGAGVEDGSIKGSACNCGDRVYEPPYLDSRNNQQLYPIYQLAYLQGTALECANCLRLPGSNCAYYCGSPQYASYVHIPSGQSCATCMLASSSLYDLTPARLGRLRSCAYAALEAGNDPWLVCGSTVNTWLQKTEAEAQTALSQLLNGVATHYLMECPSRPLEEFGAVCGPNLYANPRIPMQVLARGPAENSPDGKYFPVWWDGVACMNAMCQLQPRTDCYMKRHKIVFHHDALTGEVTCSDQVGSGLACHVVGNLSYNGSSKSALFNKNQQQYVYTDPLDRSTWTSDASITGMRRKSLEVWASVDPSDAIVDLNYEATRVGNTTASSSWGMDYEPGLAVDGSNSTFWQSHTSVSRIFNASWTIDFGLNVQHARVYRIFWEYRARNFTVSISQDGNEWEIVDRVSDNNLDSTSSSKYFKFRKLRIEMTEAVRARPAGQDAGLYAYGIREIEINRDSSVATLKPINVTQVRNFVIEKVLDGNWNTVWSTPPDTDSAVLEFTYFGSIAELAMIRAVFRENLVPKIIDFEFTDSSGAWNYVTCASLGCDSDPAGGFDYIVSLSQIGAGTTYSATRTKFRVTMSGTELLRGHRQIQISEFDVYQDVVGSVNFFNSNYCVLLNRQVCSGIANGLGTVEPGSTVLLTNWTSTTDLDSDEHLGTFTIEFQDIDSLPGSVSIFSPSDIGVFQSTFAFSTLNVFAVVINDVSDITVRIVAKAGSAAVISKAVFSPIKKLPLVSPSADSEWVEVYDPSFPAQGVVGNLIDGDYRTEWRTQLGAPAMTGTSSIDLDYELEFFLEKHIPIDMVYVEFSFASDWFRLEGTSASGGDGYSCEWTPGLRSAELLSTGGFCKNGVISVIEKDNYYRFTNRLTSDTYWKKFSLTLMQVSAMDTLAGLAVIGIKEIEVFSANPALVPQSVEIDGLTVDPTTSLLFDQDLGSEITLAPQLAGNKIWIDLGLERIEKIEIWWSLNSTKNVPISATVGVVYDPSVVSCDDDNAAQALADAALFVPSVGKAVVFTGALNFFETPVRCVFISLYATVDVSISEIILTKSNPTVGAVVVDSSLLYAALAVDGNATTSAVADSSGQLMDSSQYVMFDLAPDFIPGTPVWGIDISMNVIGEDFSLDPDSGITMHYCPPGADLATCIASGIAVTVPVDLKETFSIGPPLVCAGCSRIAVVFKPSDDSKTILGNWFSVGEITIYASENQAGRISSILFDDERAWTNVVGQANDGSSLTPWVSELDITDASIVVSLIAEGDGLSLPAPTYISSLTVDLFSTATPFSLYSSIDGQSWNLENDLPFFAQYLKLSLSDPPGNLFAVSEITAISPPSLESDRPVSASSTAVDSNYAVGGLVWLSLPPQAQVTFSLNPGTILAGVSLSWLFPPESFTVSFISGGVVVHTQSESFVSDPSVQTPSSFLTTLHGYPMPVDSVRIIVTEFKTKNFVKMAALTSVYFYEVFSAYPLADAVAPADDDSPDYLTDSDLDSFYTSPLDQTGRVTISLQIQSSAVMGKLAIIWQTLCQSFSVVVTVRTAVGGSMNVTIFNTTDNADSMTEIYFALAISEIYILMDRNANGDDFAFSVYEIQLWEANQIVHTAISSETGWSSFQPEMLTDNSSDTMWMAQPSTDISPGNPVYVTIDLGSVFKVKQVIVLWAWAPFSNDWLETLIASRRDFQVSSDGISYNSVVSDFRFNSTGRSDRSTARLELRYFRIAILASYVDAELDPTGQLFGVSIRDLEIQIDDNIGRDNQDKAVMDDWWNFSPSLTGDVNNNTLWLSQRGQSQASLISDFGEIKTIGGVHVLFQYIAGTVGFYRSDDCLVYTHVNSVGGNVDSLVSLSGQQYQFRARCVKISLANALTSIQNPDTTGGPSQAIFGVKMLSIMEHNGGGGLFGIEAKVGGVWGSVFDSIVYAPFQPRQWVMLSNQQVRTTAVDGPDSFDDISSLVHVVATFNDTMVVMYRNGVQFGSACTTNTIRWDMVEDVRLVVGVRSSAFVNTTDFSSIMGGPRISYLDPYFSGQIKSAALISRALLPEEVRGLYLAGITGAREQGCLCYDSCPVGRNRLYPDVDVPCSGQGVCRRAYDELTGMPTTGVCECNLGFFGANCQEHCSLNGGCCSLDDDCPSTMACDTGKYTCVAPR